MRATRHQESDLILFSPFAALSLRVVGVMVVFFGMRSLSSLAASPPPNPATDGMEVFPPTWRTDGLYDDEFFPFIDQFGQYRHLSWDDKVSDLAGLTQRFSAEQDELVRLRPSGFSRYGGWRNGPRLEATGFFRRAKFDGKWWLVDPEGYLFHSNGLTTVSSALRTDATGASAMRTGITNRENFFEPLPPVGDIARTLGLVTNETATVTSGEYQGLRPLAANFFAINARIQFGATTVDQLRAQTSTLAFDRMRSWGFNTIGAWSDPDLFGRADRQPYTHMLQPTHPGLINGSTTYLDYFKDAWVANLRTRLNQEVGKTIGDAWNMGFYIDNERDWTKSTASAYGLGLTVLASPAEDLTHYAKRVFRDQLQQKYGTIAALNAQWSVSFASWDEFLTRRDVVPAASGSNADMDAFEQLYVETYFRTCRDVMREIAPQHLYLGCRFTSGARPPVLELAARYVDVLTINLYGSSARLLTGMDDDADVPLMCTEFYFFSHDTGLFASAVGGGVRRDSQSLRASAMKSYVNSFAAHTRYVGTHWFQYFDFPPSGRLNSRNMNSNLGFVATTNLPYVAMVKAAREANYAVYRTRVAPPKQEASADAVVDAAQTGSAAGTGTLLEVSGTKEAYLFFDLAAITTTVERALLLLTPVEGGALATHELSLVADSGWNETNLTWSNRPLNTTTLARWIVMSGLPVEIDITRELREAFRGNRRLSFRIASVDGTTLRYAAREHPTVELRPQILLITGPTQIEAWRERYFAVSSATAGNLDDPDGDGVANLLEYAFALDPHEADFAPVCDTQMDDGGQLSITFYRARADITYIVEASSDLQQWIVIATNPGNVGATVKVTAPSPAGVTRRFLRLRVTGR